MSQRVRAPARGRGEDNARTRRLRLRKTLNQLRRTLFPTNMSASSSSPSTPHQGRGEGYRYRGAPNGKGRLYPLRGAGGQANHAVRVVPVPTPASAHCARPWPAVPRAQVVRHPPRLSKQKRCMRTQHAARGLQPPIRGSSGPPLHRTGPRGSRGYRDERSTPRPRSGRKSNRHTELQSCRSHVPTFYLSWCQWIPLLHLSCLFSAYRRPPSTLLCWPGLMAPSYAGSRIQAAPERTPDPKASITSITSTTYSSPAPIGCQLSPTPRH